MINSMMDMLFLSQMVDMLSYDNGVGGETHGDEVDVYLSEVCL